MGYVDRRDAGRQLAERLSDLRSAAPVVLALPRGGVPVAAEVARRLGAPLDVLVVRKVGCPWQPELGMGAVGEGGTQVLNHGLIAQLGVSKAELRAVIDAEQRELDRRVRAYRGSHPPVTVAGRTVIVVDDGLATGFTARTAVAVLRAQGAARIIVAVPVAPRETVDELSQVADDVICLETPAWFMAIGAHYDNFGQTSDAEVRALLAEAGAAHAPADPRWGTQPDDPVRAVEISTDGVSLEGTLQVPADPLGVVLFAHGSGSSRFSPRNLAVAEGLNRAPETVGLAIGYFGASTGAAAALRAAATLDGTIAAVVSRGGRPDLAAGSLPDVTAPSLLIVGGRDHQVLRLNQLAQQRLRPPSSVEVVPGAGHLFEEPGALETVAEHATTWLTKHLHTPTSSHPPSPAR